MSSAFHSFFDETRAEHHTRLYRSGELVVRRGFAVRIRSDETSAILKPYSAHRDNRRNVSRSFEVSTQRSRHGWSLEEYDGDILLNIPADAAVGLYELTIGDYSDTLIVLFNPWCKDDEVYMQGTAEKREYVLNDAGRIWVGTADSYSSRSWYFGQFEVESLLASIDLVDRMSPKDRGSAIKVSRFLSAIINSQDDNGVITGNWSGNYSGGVSPLAWTGSTEILQKYWKRRRPVRYGQCWVYSGVFTSVLRSLGIPARCITNFNSAHDSTRPYNRAVDKYFDVNGKLIEELSGDSIWNFHVWNEAYMTRPDLNEIASSTGLDFDGWQAVDATPQETSHGLYRMGPCPLAAIKNGVKVNYDTDFVIGEVNADILHFWQNEDGKFVLKSKHKRHVGKKISTKAIGSDARDDTTHEYKYPEGSREEREALARRPSNNEEIDTTDKDVSFKAIVPADVRVGVPIQVAVEARSRSRRSRTVLMRSLCRVIDYTGSPRHTVDEKDGTFKIRPGSKATLDLRIDPEEYMDDLAKGAPVLQIYSTAKVKETGQTWSWENLVHLNLDRMLRIRAPETIERWESSEVQISITNMSSRNLTNVILRFEGLNRLFAYRLNDIEVGAEVKLVVDVRAWEYGDQTLIATLDTDEMRDISASTHVNVI